VIRVLTAVLFAGLSTGVSAETIQHYDSSGHPQGYQKCNDGRCQDYDRTGHPEGWSQQKGDSVQLYDITGHPNGSYKIKR
jgi:hypothetical protein